MVSISKPVCLQDKPCKSHLWVMPGTRLILDVFPSLPQSWCQVHIQWQPFTWCHLLGAEESLTLQAVHLICSSSVNFHVPPCLTMSQVLLRGCGCLLLLCLPVFTFSAGKPLWFFVLIPRACALGALVFSQAETYLLPVVVNTTTIAAVNRTFRFWY